MIKPRSKLSAQSKFSPHKRKTTAGIKKSEIIVDKTNMIIMINSFQYQGTNFFSKLTNFIYDLGKEEVLQVCYK